MKKERDTWIETERKGGSEIVKKKVWRDKAPGTSTETIVAPKLVTVT